MMEANDALQAMRSLRPKSIHLWLDGHISRDYIKVTSNGIIEEGEPAYGCSSRNLALIDFIEHVKLLKIEGKDVYLRHMPEYSVWVRPEHSVNCGDLAHRYSVRMLVK